jgi:hypothetical protein
MEFHQIKGPSSMNVSTHEYKQISLAAPEIKVLY